MGLRDLIGAAIPELIDLLHDSESDVRKTAGFALAKLAEHGKYRSKVLGALLS